ncbi:hypothetical protein SMC26_13930 [Actinomadura fulvescens]
MLSRHGDKKIQNKLVAKEMRHFFNDLPRDVREDHESAAKVYAKYLTGFHGSGFLRSERLRDEKKITRSRYYIGLSSDTIGLSALSKRATLITDTLLLTDDKSHDLHVLFESSDDRVTGVSVMNEFALESFANGPDRYTNRRVAMACSDLAELGRWILDAEPLLRAGLAWYLPRYFTARQRVEDDTASEWSAYGPSEMAGAVDYLIADGRAVDASGASPEKSQIVRPILEVELPFIDGVDLPTFAKITVDEFNSYVGFRNFLRGKFLELEEGMNATQSQRALDRISVEILDQIHAITAEMNGVRRNRAVAATTAGVGTVSAILAAVYGPALQEVIQMIGASGGAWGILNAMAQNSPKSKFKDNKWYYVWALQREAQRI